MKYYVDHTTKVPQPKQKGTRRKPYGSMFQLALVVKPGNTVKVCLAGKPGKPVVDFTVPVREVRVEKTTEEYKK